MEVVILEYPHFAVDKAGFWYGIHSGDMGGIVESLAGFAGRAAFAGLDLSLLGQRGGDTAKFGFLLGG